MLKILRKIVQVAGIVVAVGGMILTALGQRSTDAPPEPPVQP